MALRARLIARGCQIDTAMVFCVTLCAGELRARARRVMFWAVVACQASRIRGAGGEDSRLLHMARGAFLFQNSMSLTQSAPRINAVVTFQEIGTQPHDCNGRRENRQQQLRPLERSWLLEIVQVNSLRDRFGCSCSRHC